MKKPYSKPRIYAESFELLEHIASCSVQTGVTNATYRDPDSCAFEEGGVALFNDGVKGCTNVIAPFFNGDVVAFVESLDPEAGGGCYNAFSNGNVFAS